MAERLGRYLSPPLFPIRLRELPNTILHDLSPGSFDVGSFTITTDFVSHPGATLGYRLARGVSTMAYIPDHEPALGVTNFPDEPDWTSGHALMADADLLIHDAQYTEAEYIERVGWGHSTLAQVTTLAARAGVGTLVTFHHDPAHSDEMLDALNGEVDEQEVPFAFVPGKTGEVLELA